MAWLTLDQEDNDPARFLAYLVAALQRLNPTCGTTAQTLLTSLTNPGVAARRIIGVLINDILETLPDPFALILDDLHLITELTVFAALDYLLERLPPQMHLVMGTRHDPPLALARLRARGQVAELRLADLRFTLEEAAAFLNDQLHLGLSLDDLAALQVRTEGWPVGLRLLASSLDCIPTPTGRTAFITDLAQTDRYVFDFLAEEVLSHQEPDVRTFLLETSILSELTPALCQAVTGRHDAETILEDLDRRSLFVVNLQPLISNLQPPIYRYHALFAEFLRQRLAREMPERVADLHRRAAEAQTDPSRAIGHYLAAEMWDQAAQAIERAGEQLLRQGLVDTLLGRIHALPAAVSTARPRLAYLLGVCAWEKGDLDTARSSLEAALRGFEITGDEAGQTQTLPHLVTTLHFQADFQRVGEIIQRALARPLPSPSRVQLLMIRSTIELLVKNDWAQAAADLKAALAATQEANDLDTLRILAHQFITTFALLPDGLEQMEGVCRQALTHFGDQISPVRLAAETRRAYVHLLRGRLEEAIQTGERALAINERLGGLPHVGGELTVTLALAHLARGNYPAANRLLDTAFHNFEQFPFGKAAISGILCPMVRTRWLAGHLDEARQVYARMCAAEDPHELPMAPVLRTMMLGVLQIVDRRYPTAERTLRQAAALEQKGRSSTQFGSARLLLAHLYTAWGRPQDALAERQPRR